MKEPMKILDELDDWATQVRSALSHGAVISVERRRILAGIAELEYAPEAVRLAVARCVARLINEEIRYLGTVTAFEIACAAWHNVGQWEEQA